MVGLQTKSLPSDGKYFMLWVNEPDNMNWLGEELFGNKVLFFPAFRPKHEQGKKAEAVQVLYNVHNTHTYNKKDIAEIAYIHRYQWSSELAREFQQNNGHVLRKGRFVRNTKILAGNEANQGHDKT